MDRLLTAFEVESFLPLVEKVRSWSDRTARVEFPLFPGYVFARFDLSRLADVQRVPGLIEVVRVNGYPTPIREEEIRSVRSLVEGTTETGIEPTSEQYLVQGQKVEVVRGPFRGMAGVLTEVRGVSRVVVRLAAIRMAVSVEMKPEFVQPLAP